MKVQPVLDANLLGAPGWLWPDHVEEFERECAHLLDERKLITMSITCYLLRSGGKTILVDTGLGARPRPQFPLGKLDSSLKELGVAPADIDIVILTHLHIDHVGWNTVDGADGSRQVFFPNAEFYIQQAEWDFWMTPEWLEKPGYECLGECVEPLRDTGRVRFMKGDEAITEDLTFVATPGHTPGHVAVGMFSAGERAILVGDASHHPVQLNHPDWSASADVDGELAHRTREKLFREAEADQRMFIAGHWTFPGAGRIVRLDGKRVFQAL
ncbi:MAG: MBL fold metallo-hydrolase [Dehalococcoidia bacterium]